MRIGGYDMKEVKRKKDVRIEAVGENETTILSEIEPEMGEIPKEQRKAVIGQFKKQLEEHGITMRMYKDQIKSKMQEYKEMHGRDQYNKGVDYHELSAYCINNMHGKCSRHFLSSKKTPCGCGCHKDSLL